MTRRLCAAILLLEVVALGLSVPVLISVQHVQPALAMTLGFGLAVACILVSGLLRFRWAYWLGWLIQLAVIGLGFAKEPALITLGVIFTVLWGTAFWLGRKIETERAAAEAAYVAAGGEL